uniref:Spermatogenesis associated 1 n=1 Tax=Varanus komodoensis TaxID=61221 RepID=A0A8D2JIS8_VARKO
MYRLVMLLELHVLYVPEDVWNFKLKTVPVDVISKFLSAGFIRVSPHLTLRTLRKHLGEYLGEDVIVDKFIFLKCIGKKLAVVKTKQETELKLKLFAPPYAFYPELYLLPVEESIYSSLSAPERHHNNAEYVLACASHHRPHSLPAPNLDGQISPVFGSSLKNQFSQTQENVDFLGWNEGEKESAPVLHIKQNSGIPESLEDRDLEYLYTRQTESRSRYIGLFSWRHCSLKILYIPPSLNVGFFPIGNELNIQLQHIKAERKHLEETREELVKKVKSLLEQNKFKRYYARESWKKKYFEAKKVTFSMEEVLNKLREDLELHYQKLLMQLQARNVRKKRNNLTHSINSKNNTIIQITTLQHEIDQLRRKLDHAKMKLIIEIKTAKLASPLSNVHSQLLNSVKVI